MALWPNTDNCQIPGEVVPVGGIHINGTPIIPGDTISEPISGKSIRVRSGLLRGVSVQPSSGSYQGLLDSTVLACEARVNDGLREYTDALAGKIFLHWKVKGCMILKLI